MSEKRKYYSLYTLSSGKYDCMVVCLSYESIFSYVADVQKQIYKKGITNGVILFDQLLISGNGENRFLSIKFQNGSFDYMSAKNVEADDIYHQLTSSELRKNEDILKQSILSEKQKVLITKGCTI